MEAGKHTFLFIGILCQEAERTQDHRQGYLQILFKGLKKSMDEPISEQPPHHHRSSQDLCLLWEQAAALKVMETGS